MPRTMKTKSDYKAGQLLRYKVEAINGDEECFVVLGQTTYLGTECWKLLRIFNQTTSLEHFSEGFLDRQLIVVDNAE